MILPPGNGGGDGSDDAGAGAARDVSDGDDAKLNAEDSDTTSGEDASATDTSTEDAAPSDVTEPDVTEHDVTEPFVCGEVVTFTGQATLDPTAPFDSPNGGGAVTTPYLSS